MDQWRNIQLRLVMHCYTLKKDAWIMGELSKNEFGKLVRAYREQRGWSQEQLGHRWGYSREYVSQIEGGKRKIDRLGQISKLADILQIPDDLLRNIGKLPPKPTVRTIAEADDAILQTLLESSVATVKLSWLVWLADQNITLLAGLDGLIQKLETAISTYRGQLVKPAQQVLAYAYEMKGNISFDHLRYAQAMQYFLEMQQLGEELNDATITAIALIRQGDLLRKRGRYETGLRSLESAKPFADAASPFVLGLRWNILARAHSAYGKEQEFLAATARAEEVVSNMQEDIDALYSNFTLVEVLQERAQGYSMLWQPQKALDIYQETDRLKPFRPLRDLGSYTIVKAQANAYAGDIETGIEYALKGIKLAKQYDSQRHLSRVQGMYTRLAVTPQFAKHPSLKMLRAALADADMPV